MDAGMSGDVAVLRQVPLFGQMDDQEIAGVRSIMDLETWPPNTLIVQRGRSGDLFYIVAKGHVRFIIQNAAGAELVVDEVGPGGFFGELSMLTGEPRSADVRTVDDVTTLALERDEFFDFLQKHPPAAIDVLTVLGKRLHRVDSLLRQTVSRNVNELAEEQLTLGQRIADFVAATMGSWRFIIFQSTVLIVWIMLNVTAWIRHWDPYPFILLNLALSFQAAYAAPFIMMSQNRQAAKDRLANDVDHEVNAKAEFEIGLLLRRVDDLEELVQRNGHGR